MERPTSVPERGPAAAEEAVALARARLGEARAALLHATGGASARVVLAELAQQPAAELTRCFDELPMHRFTGRVARAGGVLGAVIPRRPVPHRVVTGRCLSSTLPVRASQGRVWSVARIAVLAVGPDGVLRVGQLHETVYLADDDDPFEGPLAWDDRRLLRIPSGATRMVRWHGSAEAGEVAAPAEVLDVLAAIAAGAASASLRELELLRRLLAPGGGG